MINTITQNNPQQNFTARPNLKRTLPKIKEAIQKTFNGTESPSMLIVQGKFGTDEYKDVNFKLKFVRAFIDSLYADEGLVGHFRGLIGLVRQFRVANCEEYAKITDTVLKVNGVKNGGVYELWAKNPNNSLPPRRLDHAVTVIRAPKSKAKGKGDNSPFIAPKSTQIMDMWLGGFVGTLKTAKKRYYETLGLLPEEQLMLRRVNTFTPDKQSLEVVREKFPSLIVNKINKT